MEAPGHAAETARPPHVTETAAAENAEAPHSAQEVSTERMLAVLSLLLAASGIAIGIALFGKTPMRKLPQILDEKWRVDELYNGYIVDPMTRSFT